MVAVWPTHVAPDAAGVPWEGCGSGESGEASRGAESVHVPTGAGDELPVQRRAHAGHAEENLRVPVLAESGRDACVYGGDLFVQGQDRPGQGVHHGGGCALPGHGGVLGLPGDDGSIGHGLGATDVAVLQPGREPPRANPAHAGGVW